MKNILASTVNFLTGLGPALIVLSYMLVGITDQSSPNPYAWWEAVLGYLMITAAAFLAGWLVAFGVNWIQGASHQTAKQKMAEEWRALLGAAGVTVLVELITVFVDINNFYAFRVIGFTALGAGVALWLAMWAYSKLKTKN